MIGNSNSDSELIIAFQNGNQQAISILVKRWHYQFCKQAYWYTKNKDIAKDIAQESWTIVIQKLNQLKDPEKFGYWALAIVCRKAIDWTRQNNTQIKKLKDYHYTVNTSDAKAADNNQKILKTIAQLPENQQAVIRLFYVQNYTLAQISETLQLSKGTVKSRLFYAREKLKTILKKEDYEK